MLLMLSDWEQKVPKIPFALLFFSSFIFEDTDHFADPLYPNEASSWHPLSFLILVETKKGVNITSSSDDIYVLQSQD